MQSDVKSVQDLANRLRTSTPSVVGRIHLDRLILNLHGILDDQDDPMAAVCEKAIEG